MLSSTPVPNLALARGPPSAWPGCLKSHNELLGLCTITLIMSPFLPLILSLCFYFHNLDPHPPIHGYCSRFLQSSFIICQSNLPPAFQNLNFIISFPYNIHWPPTSQPSNSWFPVQLSGISIMFTCITSLLHLLLLGLESYILVRSDICFFYKHIILLPYAVSQILLFPEKTQPCLSPFIFKDKLQCHLPS